MTLENGDARDVWNLLVTQRKEKFLQAAAPH